MAVCMDWDEMHRSRSSPVPQVGVAVLLCRGEKVLVCRRKSRACYNQHALPGGFLEYGETLEECACREMMEETGMEIMNVKFAAVTNTILLDDFRPVHYVIVYVKAVTAHADLEPLTLEPDRCDGFSWVTWPKVPEPVFRPLQDLLDMNYDPFL